MLLFVLSGLENITTTKNAQLYRLSRKFECFIALVLSFGEKKAKHNIGFYSACLVFRKRDISFRFQTFASAFKESDSMNHS